MVLRKQLVIKFGSEGESEQIHQRLASVLDTFYNVCDSKQNRKV